MRRGIATLAAALVTALALSACNAAGPTASPNPPGAASSTIDEPQPVEPIKTGPDTPAAEHALPDVHVFDVNSGKQLAVRSIFPASQPVLLWFWAPH